MSVEARYSIAAGSQYEFAVQEVVFRGFFGPYLLSNGTGADVFSVEGSRAPLDFNLAADTFADMVEKTRAIAPDVSSTGSGR